MDWERVRANVQNADTEDLLDRATVYREGMEPEALALIDDELRRRGVDDAARTAHAESRQGLLRAANGLPLRCARCARPAVVWGWRWGRLFRLVPLFPRRVPLCAEHRSGTG